MSRSDELKYLSCGREGMRDAATKIIIDLEANLATAEQDSAIFEAQVETLKADKEEQQNEQ